MMTIHANSATHVPLRMEQLIELNGKRPVREMVAETVQLAIFMARDRRTGRRRLTQVVRVEGLDSAGNYRFSEVPG